MAPLIPILMGLAQVAPALLKYATNSEKVEEVAEIAVQAAREIAGVEDPERALTMIAGKPELAHEYRMQVLAMEKDMDMAYLSDRQGARQAAVDGGISHHTFWFVVLIFVFVASVEGYILINGFPETKSPELLGRVLGTLDAALAGGLAWLLGSSRGSAEKTRMLGGK